MKRELYYGVMPSVVISARGEQRVREGHPWIYRSDVVEVDAVGGEIVQVIAMSQPASPKRRNRDAGPASPKQRSRDGGRTLGYALFSDRSQIPIRMLSRGEAVADDSLVRQRLERAIRYRDSLKLDADAYRLVHGEADLLPSLVIDRYGEHLVVQALSQGMERLLPLVVATLQDLMRPRGILARNDPRARLLEGLEQRVDVLAGDVPDTVTVVEGGIEYDVDLRRGQKTGLFLDQRENREAASLYARGRLLDCFSYHGGFALKLAARCTETIAFDISEDAVARVRSNAQRNGVAIDARVGNVFDELRGLERLGERFGRSEERRVG